MPQPRRRGSLQPFEPEPNTAQAGSRADVSRSTRRAKNALREPYSAAGLQQVSVAAGRASADSHGRTGPRGPQRSSRRLCGATTFLKQATEEGPTRISCFFSFLHVWAEASGVRDCPVARVGGVKRRDSHAGGIRDGRACAGTTRSAGAMQAARKLDGGPAPSRSRQHEEAVPVGGRAYETEAT